MDSVVLQVETRDRLVTEVTALVRDFCSGRGDGLVHVFLPHATAGLALLETGSGSEPDLQETLERLLPVDDRYRHRHGSHGHGRDHVVPAFVAPSLTLPVVDGEVQLGTWQSVVVVDTNGDNPLRMLRLSFLAG